MVFETMLSDLPAYIRSFLMILPAILPALILHECAHGYAAYRLGDPTAKNMGRLTLNPLKHLDLLGTLCMLFLRVGWAKPVPINPRNFKHPRRDDFIVSIAGVTANMLMFLLGCLLLMVMLTVGVSMIPQNMWLNASEYRVMADGALYRLSTSDIALYFTSMDEYLITPYMGAAWGVVYNILINFTVINISLALFNLLPIPPLDGYHVLNDLVLKKRLFASRNVMMAGQVILLGLVWSGYLNKLLNVVINWLLTGVGQAYTGLFALFGLL